MVVQSWRMCGAKTSPRLCISWCMPQIPAFLLETQSNMMILQTLLLPTMLSILATASPTLVDDPAGVSLAKRGPKDGLETIEQRQFTPTTCGALNLVCCNAYGYASDYNIAPMLALLGINIGGLYKVGLNCSPISVIGAGGGSCAAQPLCCWWGAQYNYLVAIDCEPVNMGL